MLGVRARAGTEPHHWPPVAECVCAGLPIRGASMVASGVPGRLRSFPVSLLRLELAVGVEFTFARIGVGTS